MRKYDFKLGRFRSVDALWENYRDWNGYQYALDNPIDFADPSGYEVYFSKEAYELLLKGIEAEYQAYVSYDNKTGLVSLDIDWTANDNGIDTSSNFASLMELCELEDTIKVEVSDETSFSSKGNDKFGAGWRLFSGRIICNGIFMPPKGEDSEYTTTNTTSKVVIGTTIVDKTGEKKLVGDNKIKEQVKTLCEELFGHTKLYYRGEDYQHDYKGKGKSQYKDGRNRGRDANTELVNEVLNSWENIK